MQHIVNTGLRATQPSRTNYDIRETMKAWIHAQNSSTVRQHVHG